MFKHPPEIQKIFDSNEHIRYIVFNYQECPEILDYLLANGYSMRGSTRWQYSTSTICRHDNFLYTSSWYEEHVGKLYEHHYRVPTEVVKQLVKPSKVLRILRSVAEARKHLLY